MTVPNLQSPVSVLTVKAALGFVRARGLRVSTARRLLIEALFAADAPVTAEEVARGLEDRLPPSDLASVYRNLEILERLGLVRHVHLGHGPGRYTLGDGRVREYLVCERCGSATAVHPGVLDAARTAIEAATGLQARFTHFPIAGTCAACRADEGSAR